MLRARFAFIAVGSLLVAGMIEGCHCGGRGDDLDAAADGGTGADSGSASDSAASDAGSGSDSGAPPACITGTTPSLAVDEVLDFSFCPPDPQVDMLMALWGLDPVALEMQFETENPARPPYDFAGFMSRWVAVDIENPTGMITVRVESSELDVAMLCITPDNSTYFIHDDFVGAPPNAGLNLMLPGTWTCLATTSPHTDNVPANMPLGPARFDVAAN